MPAWATLSGGLHGVALRLESQCAEERESAEARRRSTLISVRGKHNGPFEMMHGVRCTVAAPAAALKVKPQRAHKNFTWNSKPQRKEFYRRNSKSQVQRLQKQNCRSCTYVSHVRLRKFNNKAKLPRSGNAVALRRLGVGGHAPPVRTSAVPEGYRRYQCT